MMRQAATGVVDHYIGGIASAHAIVDGAEESGLVLVCRAVSVKGESELRPWRLSSAKQRSDPQVPQHTPCQ